VATAATIGMIAVPEMESRGYHKPLIYGSLAAGGTLGILIPPSIPMIIFGVMTETSVGQLYMAGISPASCWAALRPYIVGYAMVYPAARRAARRGASRCGRSCGRWSRSRRSRCSSRWCWAPCTSAS
jgi:C4-dicarboxylate transporter DctM subunit